jgi:tRNA/rRNA methyltransferase
MANFGFGELALAAPHLPAWTETLQTASTAGSGEAVWLMSGARAAVGAEKILRAARVFPSAAEAAADCALLLGTSSLQRRSPRRDVVPLPDLGRWLKKRLGADCSAKVGLLFGSEKTGLSNEELSHCHAVINIPTVKDQPSINLGQSVALVCYELRGLARGAARRASPLPSLAQTEALVARICALLDGIQGPGAGARRKEDIRRGLLDARLTKGAVSALKTLLERARGGR